MDERRQLPRWEIKKEAKVWVQGELTNDRHCIIEDMHLKGMCVSLDKQLPQGQPVRMSFAIGDDFDPVKIEAEMPWVREDHGRYVYGLLFTQVTEDGKDRIDQYINTNCYDQVKNKWWA